MYAFISEKKDYESARQACKLVFKPFDSSDLISFQDCQEYHAVQNMLMSIAQQDSGLWKELDEGLGMDIWTGTYDVPKNKMNKRSVDYEAETMDLSEVCKDKEEDTSLFTTENAGFNVNESSLGVNFTANFVPWDDKEDDKRYP